MASNPPIALILGYGSNVGFHVAKALAAKGYKIAVVSRNPKQFDQAFNPISISSDLSEPSSITEVFNEVKQTLGIPSIVVYNAAKATKNEASDPFGLSVNDFTKDLNINTTSAYIAAQEAVKGFHQLPQSASRTFIYTGNILNTMPIASMLTLGVGKSAAAYLMRAAATAYSDRGFKFYYADERKEDGTPVYSAIDGEAHGKFYTELSKQKEQGPWLQTFVKNKGYVDLSVA